jgi:hypothetical protein
LDLVVHNAANPGATERLLLGPHRRDREKARVVAPVLKGEARTVARIARETGDEPVSGKSGPR